MDNMSKEYLIETYDQVKKVFATKDKTLLENLLHFYASHRSKHDKSLDESKWQKFLFHKYKLRMKSMDLAELNFAQFKECEIFELSPNIVALKREDGEEMMGESFLYFHRDDLGTWAWCQNSDIIDFEDQALIDDEQLFSYKQAV